MQSFTPKLLATGYEPDSYIRPRRTECLVNSYYTRKGEIWCIKNVFYCKRYHQPTLQYFVG